jgi:hypothetical protein
MVISKWKYGTRIGLNSYKHAITWSYKYDQLIINVGFIYFCMFHLHYSMYVCTQCAFSINHQPINRCYCSTIILIGKNCVQPYYLFNHYLRAVVPPQAHWPITSSYCTLLVLCQIPKWHWTEMINQGNGRNFQLLHYTTLCILKRKWKTNEISSEIICVHT